MRIEIASLLLLGSLCLGCSTEEARNRLLDEMTPISSVGTPKRVVTEHLTRLGYEYHERSEELGNLRTEDGRCNFFGNASFQWRCEYPTLITTGKRLHLIDFLERRLNFYFAFDEEDRLAWYRTHGAATFL